MRTVIAATALETDEAVLDNIDTANTVSVAELVESVEQLNGVSVLLLGSDEFGGDTLLELNGDVGRLVRGVQRVGSHGPHVSGRGVVGVLQNTGLVTAVGGVGVHGPGLGLGRGNRDAGLSGIVEEIVTASETLEELGITPRSDDLDGGLDSIESQLETDLVVTLAGSTVTDELAAFALGNTHLGASNDGTSQAGSQEVATLVDGIALCITGYSTAHAYLTHIGRLTDGRETELFDKLPAQILNHHLLGTDLEGLRLNSGPVFLLTDIAEEADNLVALLCCSLLVAIGRTEGNWRVVPINQRRIQLVSRPPVQIPPVLATIIF